MIIIDRDGQKAEVSGEGTLLNVLREYGYSVPAPCGGRGSCGKCRVEVCGQGFVLSCQYVPKGDETIRLAAEDESRMQIVSERTVNHEKEEQDMAYRIAVDLGTTTIAMELTGETSGQILASWTGVNPQRAYGADVVTRIQMACQGQGLILKSLVCKCMKEGIGNLLTAAAVPADLVKKVVIAGNTTMGHLLLGYSCEGLGSYPFEPVTVEEVICSYDEIFGSSELDAQVIIMPGFSAYVGGDILSGLLTCQLEEGKRILFLDLGTNGEMALWDKGNIYVASAAAGPAFEGGNITFGTGSVPGAICGVDIRGEKAICRTIDDREPAGLCGTGLVEAVSELRRNGLMDVTGLLTDEYFERGYPLAGGIRLLQKDIREFQMAKGAIGAGLQMLLERADLKPEQIDQMYIAGGFGFYLDQEKAASIGLIPEELVRDNKVKVIGNSALAGAAIYGKGQTKALAESWKKRATEVILAQEAEFQTRYMEQMYIGR